MKFTIVAAMALAAAASLPVAFAPASAEAQVMVGRNAPRAHRRAAPVQQQHYALSVDEKYDLADAQEKIVTLDAMIAELQAQQNAGTLNDEGRALWQAYLEQRQAPRAGVRTLPAKPDPGA